jgi:hypothetical protein
VRDDAMTEIGVRLEDATVEGAASTWKLDDPGTLKKEVALKREEAAKKQAQGAVRACLSTYLSVRRMICFCCVVGF